MAFLKIVLLAILAITILWLSLLFAGPKLAQSLVSKLSENQVILIGVEVQPNLSITVSNIKSNLGA